MREDGKLDLNGKHGSLFIRCWIFLTESWSFRTAQTVQILSCAFVFWWNYDGF